MQKEFNNLIYLIEENWTENMKIINPECDKIYLLNLLSEGLYNFEKYPDDKMARWLGYIVGVLSFYGIRAIIKTQWKLIRKKPKNGERKVIKHILNHYLKKEDNIALKALLINNKKNYLPILYQHFNIGYYQGLLIANNKLDIKKERDFTRPLFHSYYDHQVRSFHNKK